MSTPSTEPSPLRDVVLVGGGHAHVQVLRRWAMRPPPRARVTLVVDRPVAIYSGMVPGLVAGQYRREELEIDVVPLARRARARVVLAPAVRIDVASRRIAVAGRAPLRYDLASFDIGSTVAGLERPGVRAHAIPTRPIARLVDRVPALVEEARRAARDRPFRVVVVGGGAGGVELAFTLEHRLRAEGVPVDVRILQALPRILPGYPEGLVARIERRAAERGIGIECGRQVVAVEPGAVAVDGGARLGFDALLWVAGAAAHPLFVDSGLPTDDRGFVWTRSTLQIRDDDRVFAVGDCASLLEAPRTPKAGVYAVRQGPVLAANLEAALEGRRLRPYRPQKDFLTLLNLGDGTAVGAKAGLSFEGAWVMSLKDRIDRRFMRRFQVLAPDGGLAEPFARLPDMSASMRILCGGCAAKVGQSALERALRRLPAPAPDPSVRLGLDAPDDAAAYETPRGDLVVRSVDGFRAFTDDPYLVGRGAAVNALSDLYATGAEPRYALALVAVPVEAAEEEAEEILYQVLSGARDALDGEEVRLLGGHTVTGPELFVGFSVDGLAPTGRLLTTAGLAPGEVLVLTKPLGTGVLLHADMLGRARGPWIEKAFASMARTNGVAADLARRAGVRAMTDVTGFGLVGHLATMLRASRVAARIDVARLPALDGAVELLARGVRSTFHEENARARRALAVRPEAAADPRFELLFDPQTSGGLLFSAAAETAAALVDALRAAGETAAAIGRVTAARADGALAEIVAGGIEAEEVAGEAVAPGDGAALPRRPA